MGVQNLEELLKLKEQFRDLVDIEFVAFPQSGILTNIGTEDYMSEAVETGAEVVGGLDPAGFNSDIEG